MSLFAILAVTIGVVCWVLAVMLVVVIFRLRVRVKE